MLKIIDRSYSNIHSVKIINESKFIDLACKKKDDEIFVIASFESNEDHFWSKTTKTVVARYKYSKKLWQRQEKLIEDAFNEMRVK